MDLTPENKAYAVRALGERFADPKDEERNRSTALSYAKDLCIAGIIKLDQLNGQAQKNYEFIKRGQNENQL